MKKTLFNIGLAIVLGVSFIATSMGIIVLALVVEAYCSKPQVPLY